MFIGEASGVYSEIIDNSVYTDDQGIRTISAMFPIFSTRGPDNVLMKFGSINTLSNIEKVYGKPNFSKYGQSYHNATQWAKLNYDTIICRLMPSDAKYANLAYVYSKTKKTLTQVKSKYTQSTDSNKVEMKSCDLFKKGMVVYIGEEALTVDKIEFNSGNKGEGHITFKETIKKDIEVDAPVVFKEKKVITKALDNITSDSIIEEKVNHKVNLVEDKETIEDVFMVIRAIGRGIDYNKFSVSINSLEMDEDNPEEFITYNLRLFDKASSNGLDFPVNDNEFHFSFNPEAEDANGMSLYIKENAKLYGKQIGVFVNDVKVKKIICDLYDLDYTTAQEHEIYSKDIFSNNSDFLDINKNRFSQGSDGSLWDEHKELNWGKSEEWEGASLTNCVNLIKALYDGSIDKYINNDVWYPIKYIFDANYPLPVKIAMANFANSSKYTRAIIDAGIKSDPIAEINWRDKQFQVSSDKVTIYPNNGMTIDPYTGNSILVTSTYNIVKKYAYVKNTYGFHYAVGGYNDKGLMDEMSNIRYSPLPEEKNNLVKKQLNTIEQAPDGIYIVENTTSSKKTSALQQNHIADSLQDMEYQLRQFCRKYILNLRITDSNLKNVESEISNFLNKYIANGCCEYINTKVTASPLQRAKQQFLVQCRTKFPSLARQILLQFTVEGEK